MLSFKVKKKRSLDSGVGFGNIVLALPAKPSPAPKDAEEDTIHVGAVGNTKVVAGFKPNPFDDLPMEINQHIGSYLTNDRDVCNFRLICHTTNNATEDAHFWFQRFRSVFEKPSQGSHVKDAEDFKFSYQQRMKILKKKKNSNTKWGKLFKNGDTDKEKECLNVLRDLMLDAFSEATAENHFLYESRNVQHLIKYCEGSDLIEEILDPHYEFRRSDRLNDGANAFLNAIQVMLAPQLLRLEGPMGHGPKVLNFPKSQQMAYKTATEKPIFVGCNSLDIDMEWLLHQINFWRYHMVRQEEFTLYQAYSSLEEHERPRFWQNPLGQSGANTRIGKHWKGAYAFVDHKPIRLIRAGKNDGDRDAEMIQDEFNGEEQDGEFQDLTLNFTNQGKETWLDAFENILKSTAEPVSRARTRAQHRSIEPDATARQPTSFRAASRFNGEGSDDEEKFAADGWLNPLPPQHGIPGWQRMTMMKYYEDDHGIDMDALWAYEGVVLPGGQMMVGRWWSPNGMDQGEDMYSGPFLLWCVDGKGGEIVEEEGEGGKSPLF